MRGLHIAALVLAFASATFAQEKYVVVGPSDLVKPVAPLMSHRAAEGMVTSTITWTRTPGSTKPGISGEVLQRKIHALRPTYVLLVGDVDATATFVVRKAATDRPYGDFNGDGFPEAAVGRIPSNDAAVIARVVGRTIQYETQLQAGQWQKQCALLANEGRFSPTIDALIEKVFARVIRQVLPTGYDVDLTYANPRSEYCFPPQRFAQRVVSRLNEGSLVFAYIGHGSKRSLDQLEVPRANKKGVRRYRVLDVRDVPRLKLAARSPIMVAIACWTANIDGKRQSIGEELMASPDGPVAFFGATRISHPVHNALLAKELVTEFFSGAGVVRLGPALDRARHALVKGRPKDALRRQLLAMATMFMKPEELDTEFPRHVDMYVLLGDPALRLARPEGRIQLRTVREGQTLRVTGQSTLGVKMPLRVTLETDREAMAIPKGPQGETREQRYVRANDKVLSTELVVTDEQGRFSVVLRAGALKEGRVYLVKAFASDGKRSAVGGSVLR
jgi:hypothetical protein